MKFILVVLLLLLTLPIVSADTLTVSGNSGEDIQKAINDAENGDTVIIPADDYYVSKPITQTGKSFSLMGEGKVTLNMKTANGLKNGLHFEGSSVTAQTLSTGANEGDNQIVLSDASKVNAGDLVRIWKNVLWCPLDYPTQLTGEMYEVKSVSGNTITLTESLLRDYPSASSHVEICRPVEIHIENIGIQDSSSSGDRMAITLELCKDSSIKDVWVKDSGIAAISLYSCFNVDVSGCDIRNSVKPGSGYGVGAWSGSAFINIHNNYIENCRHCVTGNTNERNCLLRDIVINNNELIGASIGGANVVDAHAITINYKVTNNKITIPTNFYAFIDGSLNSEFSGNTVNGGNGAAIGRGNINGGKHIVKNNYVEKGDLYKTYGGGAKDSLIVEGNTQGPGGKGVTISVGQSATFKNVIVDGNVLNGAAVDDTEIEHGEHVEPVRENIITVTGYDDKSLNTAMGSAKSGDVVFLPSGEYLVKGPIYFRSSGVTLRGEAGTVIKVAKTSTQWFRGLTGIINSIGYDDITIDGIETDGSCDELDSSLADSSSATSHDCERGIVIQGSSGDFVKNIVIKNVIVRNTFSDGVHVRFAENVLVEDCEMSNCQHDSIYFVLVRNGIMKNNKVAGITADCLRFDNCEYSKALYNTLFSYSGSQANGAYLHGENGVQVGNQGHSKGGGSDKSGIINTNNIEIAYNKIINCGLEAVLLDAANLGLGDNIYIHDNEIIGDEEFETSGIPVEILNDIEEVKNGKTPTKELTEEVFDSIFDIFNLELTETGITDQSPDSCEWTVKAEEKGGVMVRVEIIGYKNKIWYNNQWWVSSPDDLIIKTQAIQRPVFSWVGDSVEKIDENLSISTVGNNTTATFSVTTTFKHTTKNSKTGKTRTTRYAKSSVTTDSIETVPVLDVPANVSGVIYVYPTSFQVSVPSNMLTRVEYEYDGNKSTHVYQVGTRNTTETGIIFTEFSPLERWSGELGHQGDYINVIGVFDQDKLKVVACTPYGKRDVTDLKIIKNEYPEKAIANWLYPFIIALGILLLYLKSLYGDLKKY